LWRVYFILFFFSRHTFSDVGFPPSEKVWRERKKEKENNSAKYNGSFALATLEQATNPKCFQSY